MTRSFIIVVWLLLFPVIAHAAPKAELWPRWSAHDAASQAVVDHTRWQDFLGRYVLISPDGVNRVAYARVTDGDGEALQSYIRGLGQIAVSALSRPEQRAYWINLYNVLTVDLVLDAYPVTTIRKINSSPGWFSTGPWGRKLIAVEGEKISLDDIEHRILRPIWKDPRIHYALNCASFGCPNLQRRAFTAANSESLLDTAARQYVNHPRGARIDDARLRVSSIYIWFKDDFGGTDAGVIDHLMDYAEPALKAALMKIGAIADDAYDWSLNE